MKLRIANEAYDRQDTKPWTPYQWIGNTQKPYWLPMTWPLLRTFWTDDVMAQLREMVK